MKELFKSKIEIIEFFKKFFIQKIFSQLSMAFLYKKEKKNWKMNQNY